MGSYYDVLGVTPDAEDVVVTAAYRALMRRYHPDAAGMAFDPAHATLINQAYAILSNPQRRAAYDARLSSGAPDAEGPEASRAAAARHAAAAAHAHVHPHAHVHSHAQVPPAASGDPPALRRRYRRIGWTVIVAAVCLGLALFPRGSGDDRGDSTVTAASVDGWALASPRATLASNPAPGRVPADRAVGDKPDLSRLTPDEQASIESVCATARITLGQGPYQACVSAQLADLAASGPRPDLTSLGPEELASINSACLSPKLAEGPAAFNRCLSRKLALMGPDTVRPDLSALTQEAVAGLERTCAGPKLLEGPAAYDRCLKENMPRPPRLARRR